MNNLNNRHEREKSMILSLMIFLWTIGFMFSIGLCTDNEKGWEGVALVVLFFLFWPLLLGAGIRNGWFKRPSQR